MKQWSSYGNSYLRYLESSPKEDKVLTISLPSLQALQLVLDQILMYEERTKSGKVDLKCPTQISLNVYGSEVTT